MQFSQDSFKARIKVPRTVPSRSVAADPARRISTSTPMSGIAVLDFVRRWWSIFLRRAPELLSEGSACLICGIRQFISLFYLSRFPSRIIPVEKCCARWSRAGNFFYLFISRNFSRRIYFSRVSSQIARLNIHLYVFLFLTNFTGIVLTRRDRRARVSVFAVSSLARFLFLCGPPMFLRSRDPIGICILKQQIRLGYALIIRVATGTTYSEVKVAGHDRAEPFSL